MNKNNNPSLTKFSQDLRSNMTKEEKHLWYDFLKRLPLTVRRQHVIENYIVDFYIAYSLPQWGKGDREAVDEVFFLTKW